MLERFCSTDLAPVSAYYNPATGKGTQTRIFLTAEETDGKESYPDYLSGKQAKGGQVPNPVPMVPTLDRSKEVGRAFAMPVEGEHKGEAWELQDMGRFRWENATPNPHPQDLTIVAGLDDADPSALYFYLGEKGKKGTDVEKAGLTGGTLYTVAVEDLTDITPENMPLESKRFKMVALNPDADGLVSNWTQPQLRSKVRALGATDFDSMEDGNWDPADPNTLYFAVTDSKMPVIYSVKFDDVTNPTAGGTVQVIFNGNEVNAKMGKTQWGDEHFKNPDNMTAVLGKDGHTRLLIQEDRGGQNTPSRIWYVVTNELELVAQLDPERFAPGAPHLIANVKDRESGKGGDEESASIIPAYDILGEGWFLLVRSRTTMLMILRSA